MAGWMDFLPMVGGAVGSYLQNRGKSQMNEQNYQRNVRPGLQAQADRDALRRGIGGGIFQAYGLVTPKQAAGLSMADPVPKRAPQTSNAATTWGGMLGGLAEQFGGMQGEPFDNEAFWALLDSINGMDPGIQAAVRGAPGGTRANPAPNYSDLFRPPR
jgi:hypothetical protein